MDEVLLSRGKNCLLVELLSKKYFNREAFKATMQRVWKPIHTVKFYELGDGIMLAEFKDQSDKKRVIVDKP